MDITLKDLQDLLCDNSSKGATAGTSFIAGNSYFIRTVTYHCVGRVKTITETDLLLEDGAWIADSGRFSDAIKDGTLREVEPVEQIIVARGAIIDAFPWTHALPRDRK